MNAMRVNIAGVEFKNPIIAASGTFAFGEEYEQYFDISKLGGIAVKALTIRPRQGNPAPRIAETPMGMLNAVGLQNPGVDAFIQHDLKRLSKKDTVIIANIAGSNENEYCKVAMRLSETPVDMIELNISCPNVKEGGAAFGVYPESVEKITAAVRAHCKKPLIVKLTPNTADIVACACAAVGAGADAISLINTLTGMAIDADAMRPVLGNITGGLSGPAIKPVALRMVYEVSQAVSVPVIGMGGIRSGRDAAEFILAGASAVMVGTATIADPLACMRIIDELGAYLSQKRMSARMLRGALKI